MRSDVILFSSRDLTYICSVIRAAPRGRVCREVTGVSWREQGCSGQAALETGGMRSRSLCVAPTL